MYSEYKPWEAPPDEPMADLAGPDVDPGLNTHDGDMTDMTAPTVTAPTVGVVGPMAVDTPARERADFEGSVKPETSQRRRRLEDANRATAKESYRKRATWLSDWAGYIAVEVKSPVTTKHSGIVQHLKKAAMQLSKRQNFNGETVSQYVAIIDIVNDTNFLKEFSDGGDPKSEIQVRSESAVAQAANQFVPGSQSRGEASSPGSDTQDRLVSCHVVS